MNRFNELKQIFKQRKCFKLVCGAGNEDVEEVRRLATTYTLAGAVMLDLSANIEVVRAAKKGIERAFELSTSFGKKITTRPFLNVSIGLKGDPHVRKARIDTQKCTGCGACLSRCRQNAITEEFTVKEYKCMGFGDCANACEANAISFAHSKADFEKLLPLCRQEGIETMELHAVTDDEDAVFNDWKLLNKIIDDNYVSMCLDRKLLSNVKLVERIKKAFDISGDRLIIQADGVPMSGEGDDFRTTLQAVACADIVEKSGIPAAIMLSGGTNSRTGILAKQCGVSAHGVAIGSWARKIVREYVTNISFDNDPEIMKKAINKAEELIQANMSALTS